MAPIILHLKHVFFLEGRIHPEAKMGGLDSLEDVSENERLM